MKSVLNIFGALLLMASMPVDQVRASEDSSNTISRTEFLNQVDCDHGSELDNCVATIRALQSRPEYQHPEAQYQIAERVKYISGIHPATLDLAYEILTELLQDDPDNYRFKMSRAYVKFYQNKIDGIAEGKTAGATVLRDMLDIYLKQGHIQRDVKRLSVEAVHESLERNEPVHFTVSEIQNSIDAISRYGSDKEVEEFITSTRGLIPWDKWHPDMQLSPIGSTELTAENSSIFLFTYCLPTMLKFDGGTFCEVAISHIHRKVDKGILAENQEFQRLGKFILSQLAELQSEDLINAEENLKELVKH